MAQHLFDRLRRERRRTREQLPLVRMLREQPQGVCELGMGGVDAAGDDIED